MKKVPLIILTAAMSLSLASNIFAAPKFEKAEKVILIKAEQKINKVVKQTYITKADFIVKLHSVLNISLKYFAAPNIEAVYSDVKNSDSFADKLYDLYSLGIVDDKAEFNPTDNITRSQALHYVLNALNYLNNQNNGELNAKNDFLKNKKYSDTVKAIRAKLITGKEIRLYKFRSLLPNSEANSLISKVVKFNQVAKPVKVDSTLTVIPKYEFANGNLVLTAQISNQSKDTVKINFNSGHQYSFILLDSNNKELYNSSRGIFFIQTLTSIELKQGESKVFTQTLLSSDQKDIIDKAAYLKVEIPGKTDDGKLVSSQSVRIQR